MTESKVPRALEAPPRRAAPDALVLGPAVPQRRLRATLDALVASADRAALVRSDPVELVHRYRDPHDQEVAGFVVAALAYGRVASIKAAAGRVLDALGPAPAAAVDGGRRAARLSGFVYRFQRGEDLPRLLGALGRVRRRHGSLAAAFAAHAGDEPRYDAATARFVAELRAAAGPMPTRGLTFLLPDPGSGGAAKRLCLYLRWMIRPADGLDLGAWRILAPALDPARLVIPLDTHIGRIARYLGLTTRRADDLETAIQITDALAALAPGDPLVYDMALCHLGISGQCPRQRDPVKCVGCPIRAACRLGPEPPGWPR